MMMITVYRNHRISPCLSRLLLLELHALRPLNLETVMSRICGEMTAIGGVMMMPCCEDVDRECEMVG